LCITSASRCPEAGLGILIVFLIKNVGAVVCLHLREGSFFGETPFLEALEGKGGSGKEVRTRTIRASVETDLGFIKREDMLELVESYPELQIRIRQFARTGLKVSKKAKSAREAADILMHAAADKAASSLQDAELDAKLSEAEKEMAEAKAKYESLAAKKKSQTTNGLPNTAEVSETRETPTTRGDETRKPGRQTDGTRQS
jgi:CRP-like cAMP-binding protein